MKFVKFSKDDSGAITLAGGAGNNQHYANSANDFFIVDNDVMTDNSGNVVDTVDECGNITLPT